MSKETYTTRDRKQLTAVSKKYILDELKRFVSGQNKVLDKIAFISHMYSKKILWDKIGQDIESTPKLNLLITGPTGCGKTHIIKALSKTLQVPYLRIDCSTITGSGWKGPNVDKILDGFSKKSPSGIGIIHLDEFDKLGMSAGGTGNSQEFMLAKQTNILDLLDGDFKSAKAEEGEAFNINKCLVIMTGSFQCFREGQKDLKDPIGFKSGENEDKKEVTNWRKQLSELGFIPELANRIVTSEELEPYTKDDIKRILYNTENNAYAKHKNLAMASDTYVNLSDEQLSEIIDTVHTSEVGMREIDSLLFEKIYENQKKSEE